MCGECKDTGEGLVVTQGGGELVSPEVRAHISWGTLGACLGAGAEPAGDAKERLVCGGKRCTVWTLVNGQAVGHTLILSVGLESDVVEIVLRS
jgi:hypothetical protein